MKSSRGLMLALIIVSGGPLVMPLSSRAASQESQEATAMMGNSEAEQQAAARAREKDTSWKPSCKEVNVIKVTEGGNPQALRNFCLNMDGNLLVCYGEGGNVKNTSGLRIYSPKGELLKTWPLEIRPDAVCVARDSSIFVAGDGRLLKLDAAGKVLASVDSPVAHEKVTITKETEDMVKEMAQQTKRSFREELASMKTNLENRRANVTGLAVTDQDVFMAVPAPGDFSYRVYRFNHALAEPKLVVEKLHGCCGQMDIQSHDGKLWIPHNARHAVENRDRDGKELSKFGKAGRVKASDFGGCCEPKNLRVLANGDILAAESGPPTCIKRFSADGKFKEVIAVVNDSKGDCVRVTVERSPDGRSYYMLDTTKGVIHVFATRT